jgi:hypothetical protein
MNPKRHIGTFPDPKELENDEDWIFEDEEWVELDEDDGFDEDDNEDE